MHINNKTHILHPSQDEGWGEEEGSGTFQKARANSCDHWKKNSTRRKVKTND